MAKRRKVSNLMALALLSLLAQQPMYPYEMAQTLKARGKDEHVKVNWGSLYTVVQNLEKNGFIEAVATQREGRQPERTTYRITQAGKAELFDWLTELIAVPEDVISPFESALSEAASFHPDDLARLLAERAAALEARNAAHEASLREWARALPRLVLIESEYRLAMRLAEASWVRGLIAEITDGTLGGVDMWRQFRETGEPPPELAELLEFDKQARQRKENQPDELSPPQ